MAIRVLRSGSVIQFSEEGLEAVADDVLLISDKEGLTAHGMSVSIRRKEET